MHAEKLFHAIQGIITKAVFAGNNRLWCLEEKFGLILDSHDIFWNRVKVIVVEEFNLSGSWNTNSCINKQVSTSSKSNKTVKFPDDANISKPQFKDRIDNSHKPWQPKIKDKSNSLKPLALYVDCEDGKQEIFCHPYEFELDKFEPPESQLVGKPPIKYKSLDDTPLFFIEKLQDLKIMLKDLENYKEIAVDLEHHSYRSFQGITCLMQISTRDTDYLIDTLSLRSELHILNEIFTKPSILKVFHGADSDILWLQRDLSLYVVNMFDTYQAAKQLELPFLSLSYLLKTHCEIDSKKHFQLADWRIRPLPEELMKYAREDTHYLLYIKDIMHNALIAADNGQNNILKDAYNRSTELCKKTYTKPVCSEDKYLSLYKKSKKMFNNQQLYALKELHKWRDETARLEDDSPYYVLPNHMLVNIAEILPEEMQGILACCNPIPPLVEKNLLKLHKMILKAREQPLIDPTFEEDPEQLRT